MPANSDECCWICLCSSSDSEPLERPCSCPRYVHQSCLGRWQLAQAGRSEETQCRFCLQALPPLENMLTPPHLRTRTQEVVPRMAVTINGKRYKFSVRPGLEGLAEFRARLKCYLGLSYDNKFDVAFNCVSPASGERLELQGMSSFNAATACATIVAARHAAEGPRPTAARSVLHRRKAL